MRLVAVHGGMTCSFSFIRCVLAKMTPARTGCYDGSFMLHDACFFFCGGLTFKTAREAAPRRNVAFEK